jgi:hypothetical protein
VTAAHLTRRAKPRIERHNLIEMKIREMISDGTLLIDTEGSRGRPGQRPEHLRNRRLRLASPCASPLRPRSARSGLINIEREANLSGRLHDKGMQIIAGFLRSQFAQDKPLSLAASICFEQSYSGVDGDSASSSEIYALLSALSGLPMRQDIAVTGSVSQQGDVQPIGGVNEKVEGFYDVCRIRGLTGTQGVLIPMENVEDLMLRDDVIDAVAAGKFHVLPVARIEEGIEILTGVPAGRRDAAAISSPTPSLLAWTSACARWPTPSSNSSSARRLHCAGARNPRRELMR